MNTGMKDAYTWQVQYKDDFLMAEFDPERPDGRGFGEVQARDVMVRTLSLVGGGPAYIVHIPEGASPVFFRRRRIVISATEDSVTPGETIHCIGWKHVESGVYLFVWDDGHTLLTSDLQAV